MARGKAPRYDGVQALRLVAALLVVGTHSTLYASQHLAPGSVWHFGEVGVDIFFVISGFVMMASSFTHLQERDYWKAFGMRRIIRIVPMYWIATTFNLMLLLVVPKLAAADQPALHHVILSYLFTPTRNAGGDVEPLHGVGWTLVFEMFFYLIFTLALMLRVNVMWFCTVVFTIAAAGAFFRPEFWPPVMVYLDPILLYFVAGMIIGKWTCDRRTRPAVLWLGYVGLLWTLGAAIRSDDGFAWGLLLRPLAVVAVMISCVLFEKYLGGHLPRPVTFMGDASYTLYLFHPLMGPVIPIVLARLGLVSVPLSITLTFVAVLIGSALIYVFVERPITRKLQRVTPYVRRLPALVSAPEPARAAESPRSPEPDQRSKP